MKLMERKLKEMVTDADMERLQAVAEPLTDMFDEIEGDRSECYITWNFGYNKYGEITCGFDVRMHPRYRDNEQKAEEIKARIDDALELCGFELDSDIKHANPSENIFGGWHYQIKKIDDTDADVELTTDDMNAGQWYESLDKDEWDGFFSHNRDLDECDEKFEEDFNVDWENNRKAKAEVVSWWKDVEKWNEENGSKFNIDNDYSDAESMFTAIYDMLSELKTANKDLYKKGKAIYNKYAHVPIKEEKASELSEDTVKTSDGKWTNKGKEGTHGKFKTKKAAGAQRKAMFANGYQESLGEEVSPERLYAVIWSEELPQLVVGGKVKHVRTRLDWFNCNSREEMRNELKDIYSDPYYDGCTVTVSGNGWSVDGKEFLDFYEKKSNVDKNKVKTLKLMHKIMQKMNNENAYYSWIVTGVPDGAYEEDYESIASDDDEYKDVVNLFNRIFKRYAKDGLYKPSSEEAQFASEKCKELSIPEIEIF